MEKTMFTIKCDMETGRRKLVEADFSELGLSKTEYTAELMNSLAVALGAKIGMTVKSTLTREALLENLYALMKETCFSTDKK